MKARRWTPLPFFFFPMALFGAVRPMSHYHDLVAGQGDPGYRDGAFQTALFNQPSGMALDPIARKLYVADSANHRIRVVDLAADNHVSTLAGTGAKSGNDGPFLKASFDEPQLLALIPGPSLLVYERSGRRFRLLDLKSGKTSTLLTGQDEVWNLCAPPEGEPVYFSQPVLGKISVLDTKTGRIDVLLGDEPALPRPSALTWHQGGLWVADRDSGLVMSLGPNGKNRKQVGQGLKVRALFPLESDLMALQDGKRPLAQISPPRTPDLMSPWGSYLGDGESTKYQALGFFQERIPSVLVDPAEDRAFFVSLPGLNRIVRLRDYRFEERKGAHSAPNRGGLMDFDYPKRKPPKTFRILLMGDSRAFYVIQPEAVVQATGVKDPQMETLGKKLELELNTLAALDGGEINFQVMTLFQLVWNPLFLWPYYKAPPLARDYDVDLALILFFPAFSYPAWFDRETTAEGIPTENDDPEFRLRPYWEKIPPGLGRDLYTKLLDKKWVVPVKETDSALNFAGAETLMADPETRAILMDMVEKPLLMLDKKLKLTDPASQKAGGRLALAYCPSDNPGMQTESHRLFWHDLCGRSHLPFADLSDEYLALRDSYFPTTEQLGNAHHNPGGHALVAFLLARSLEKEGLIPPLRGR